MSDRVSTGSEILASAIVDGLEFARHGRRLAGRVRLTSLPRLADVLADDGGEIKCEVLGESDREGNAFLVMRLDGEVGLRCQRCLETLIVPLRVASRLLLVPSGRQWPDEELAQDDYDAVEADKEMALLPMIEEEVLLALPIAPMHDSCETPAATNDEQASSPFAALAKLRKGV